MHPVHCNHTAALCYDLPESPIVVLVMYDILARHVKTLVRGVEEAGFESVPWRATDELSTWANTGVYLSQMRARDFTQPPRYCC